MQIGICNATQRHVKVRKCSQVGLSEISVRLALGMLAIYPGSTAIYTLPTAKFAGKFTKARINPVVEASKTLKDLVPSGADSSELKQFGSSFLYIVGTSGSSSPISIPADMLIRDEVDFSNQSLLSMFYSRLGHAEGGGWIRDFSTPTVDKYGISEDFDETTNNRYMILHDYCHEWVAPTCIDNIVIPGYEGNLTDFGKSDLKDPRYKIDESYLSCSSCHMPISNDNLADPEKRQWVAANPDAEIGGYQIVPFDVPFVNPISKTVKAVEQYDRKADWVNFEMGAPYQDAENSFVIPTIDVMTTGGWVKPGAMAASGCVMGIDVGKTSWAIIGKPYESGKVDILHAERIVQDDNNYLVTRILDLLKWYGVMRGVIDAGPDFTAVLQVISKAIVNQVYGCYYVRSARTALSNIDVKEEEQVLNASKVGTFSEAARRVNKGLVQWPRMAEMGTIKDHLENINKISNRNSQGELVEAWVSKGPDHYANALNYLMIAIGLCDYLNQHGAPPAPASITRAKFGKQHDDTSDYSLLKRHQHG
jgi:hypothetical protein